MSIEIKEIISDKELKTFIRFPFELYEGNPYYVPPIVDFELSTLSWKKNPAFDHCEARYFLAYKDGKVAGRIAGIIHGTEAKEKKLIRFGWIDFIDDLEVSKALLNAVAMWGHEQGLTGLHGPMGFTDLDFEGSLIKGFDQLATQATIYNHEYYARHYEAYGFEKACDWVEMRGKVIAEMPRKLERTASIITSRFRLRPKEFKSAKAMVPYANDVFEILNKAYGHLYGYYPLTEKQIKYYVDLYFGFIRKEYVTIIVNENDKPVAFAISLPSLSRAFQKAKGSLFPFGFIHVLKAFYSNKDLDLFLIGVTPEYQKLGASTLIFHELIKSYIGNRARYFSTGPMLENNQPVLNLWNDYLNIASLDSIKRRCYVKHF